MKKKINKNIPIAHKRVMSTMEKYKERVENDKDLKNEIVEQFIINVSPYFTKKGNLRKNLSKEKIQDFNDQVKLLKSQKLDTLKGIKKYNKEQKIKEKDEKRENKFIEKWVDTEKDAQEVTDLLKNKLVQRLMNKGYMDIYNLMDIAEDEEVEEVGTEAVIDYALRELEEFTPNEILDELKEDEDYQLFNDYKNNKAIDFMTRNMFKKWLKNNFEKVKRKRAFNGIGNYEELNEDQIEEQYKEFLEGKYNRYL